MRLEVITHPRVAVVCLLHLARMVVAVQYTSQIVSFGTARTRCDLILVLESWLTFFV